jgi:hypothetical protein
MEKTQATITPMEVLLVLGFIEGGFPDSGEGELVGTLGWEL